MRTWAMRRSMGNCEINLQGETILQAIEKNFRALAREAHIGNAAGYRLHRVVAEYKPGILGGKGGVEVVIQHTGLDLAHRPADPTIKTSTVWIAAQPDDLPESRDITIL